MNVGDFLRIGDGSNADYHRVAAVGAAIQHVPLSFPLNLSHAAGVNVDGVARAADAAFGAFALDQPGASGATSIVVTGAAADIAAIAAATNPLLEIGAANVGEHRFAGASTALTATTARVELLGGCLVMDYAAAAAVTVLDLTGAVNALLQPASSAGDSLIYVDSVAALSTRNDLAIIGMGGAPATVEVRRIGELDTIDLSTGAAEDYPAGSVVEEVTVADDTRALGAAVAANATSFTVAGNRLENLQPGTQVLVDPGANEETVTVASVVAPNVSITAATGFANAHAAGATVIPDFDRKSTRHAHRGWHKRHCAGEPRRAGGQRRIRIGNAPDDEYAAIRSIPARAAAGADPGNVVLAQALQRGHAAGDPVRRQAAPAPTGTQPTVLAAAVLRASTALVVTDGFGIAGGDFVRVTSPTGEQYFHRTPGGSTAANPREVTLTTELTRAHDVGAPVVGRDPLLTVEALDAGAWGNRLRVSVEDEGTGLVSRTTLDPPIDPTHIRLGSAAGVEQGTLLELTDPLNNNAVVGAPLKVDFVNRQANFTISLAGAGTGRRPAGGARRRAGRRSTKLGVRSREFRLSILLLHQADPARPTRNSIVIASEVFRHLSLDPRHSRYVHTVIGDTVGPLRLSDRRPEGESRYVRVHDPNPTTAVRLGPETLIDVLPNGQRRPARHPLIGGDDSQLTADDATYIGTDNVDPDLRTGLFTLANIDDVSIIAAPGRTTPQCRMRSSPSARTCATGSPCSTAHRLLPTRFRTSSRCGRITTRGTPRSTTLAADRRSVSAQHPGSQPVPCAAVRIGDGNLRPNGHRARRPQGARQRGRPRRHRAAAHRQQGGAGDPQSLPAEHQRHPRFPPEQPFGIRVWGGRVITSDPDWKYVNVRRLLDLHREVDRRRPAVGGLRAECRSAVGARAAHDLELPHRRLAQRRTRGRHARGGVLRQLRPHDDDAGRHRQRTADRGHRRRAGEAGRVRHHPHRAVDRARGRVTPAHASAEEKPCLHGPIRYRSFNFRVEIDGLTVGQLPRVSPVSARTATSSEYREGTDLARSVRKPRACTTYPTSRSSAATRRTDELWDWYRQHRQRHRRPAQRLHHPAERERTRRAAVVDFENAWIKKIDGPSFNATANEVAIETVELVHEGVSLGSCTRKPAAAA